MTAALFGAASVTGCSAGQGRLHATELRSLDEQRAVEIIQSAAARNHCPPGPSRTVAIREGHELGVDVGVAGGRFGIAFLAEREAAELAGVLPARPPSDKLHVFQPQPELGVLLLYSDRYQYDVGDAHSATAIAAERRLSTDVADFIVRVVKVQNCRAR